MYKPRFHVKGFFPGGTLVVVKTGFPRHRDARNYMLKRENELKARFGMKLHVAGGRGK